MNQHTLLDKMTAATTRHDARWIFPGVRDEIDQLIGGQLAESASLTDLSAFLVKVSHRADRMAPMLAMACFRLSWLWSDHVPEWISSTNRVHAAFVTRGLNADAIMTGLMD